MITSTDLGRKLGTLRIEGHLHEGAAGPGTPAHADYRPAGIVLENDGRWHHWMQPGEDYSINHDGTGWRVTCITWPADTHVYRLGAGDGTLTDRLPLIDTGAVAFLAPGHAYTLHSDGPGTWALYVRPSEA
jgi:hypothetical protein